jgi:hypothetical protein
MQLPYELIQSIRHYIEGILQDKTLSWEEKYDRIFSASVSSKIFDTIILPDYSDPDCGYKDDVMAFVKAVDKWLEQNK